MRRESHGAMRLAAILARAEDPAFRGRREYIPVGSRDDVPVVERPVTPVPSSLAGPDPRHADHAAQCAAKEAQNAL